MSSPAPSYDALLTFQERVEGLLGDHRLSGDLLILGLAMGRLLDLHPSKPRRLQDVAILAFPCPPHAHGPAWQQRALGRAKTALAADAPRYEAPPASGRCLAPVDGQETPCGVPAGDGIGATLTDPVTGEQTHMQACEHHENWLLSKSSNNRLALDAAGPRPVPAANVGGVLAEHLPELQWPVIWRTVRPGWTEPGQRPTRMTGPICAVPYDGPRELSAPMRGHLRVVE